MWNKISTNRQKRKLMQIHKCKLKTYPQVQYYYGTNNYDSSQKIENIIVIIHGISRNAEEIINGFKGSVKKNTLLVAPIFSKQYATDYQRLGRKNKGPRADYILNAIVNELRNDFGIEKQKIHLFGFSAGAQYAHRYAFAHPNLVDKVAIVAAGWYTLPTTNLDYPLGLKLNGEFTDIAFELTRILRIKFKVYIGQRDNQRDKALNKNKKIDALQGQNRIERARNWIELMQNQYIKQHIDNHIELVSLKDVKHDFNEANKQSQLCTMVNNWFEQEDQS
jgi:pimeloyl-ACP methyl ester carboxylesterase